MAHFSLSGVRAKGGKLGIQSILHILHFHILEERLLLMRLPAGNEPKSVEKRDYLTLWNALNIGLIFQRETKENPQYFSAL